MDSLGPEPTVPPIPTFTYTMSKGAAKAHVRSRVVLAVALILFSAIIIVIDTVLTTPLLPWHLVVGLAKAELVVSILLIVFSLSSYKSLTAFRIEIQGNEIRYFSKPDRLTISATLDQITSLRKIPSLLNRRAPTYSVTFGHLRAILLFEGIDGFYRLKMSIEDGSQKRF